MGGLLDCLLARVRREELLRESGREEAARELGRSRKDKVDVERSSGTDESQTASEMGRVEVRRGSVEDMPRISDFLEFNGIPRWIAFEERFIVAEQDGRIVAVLRFRKDPERLCLGLLVTEPSSDGRSRAAALYSDARAMARGLGLREVRIHGDSHRTYPPVAGFHSCETGWLVDVADEDT